MRAPIVHFGKGGCACRACGAEAAFLWRSGWLERARQTAPTTPGRVSFVATLRIVSSVSLCEAKSLRLLRSRAAVRVYSCSMYRRVISPCAFAGRNRIPYSGDGAFGSTKVYVPYSF